MDYTPTDFTTGQRVKLHPATDLWMRGARYGTIAKIGRAMVTVDVDALGRSVRLHPRDLLPVEC